MLPPGGCARGGGQWAGTHGPPRSVPARRVEEDNGTQYVKYNAHALPDDSALGCCGCCALAVPEGGGDLRRRLQDVLTRLELQSTL